MLESLLGIERNKNITNTYWNIATSYNTTVGGTISLTNNNLTATIKGGGGTISPAIYASKGKNTGKWYFEVTSDINAGGASAYMGFAYDLTVTNNIQETSAQICVVSIPSQSRTALGYKATSTNIGAAFLAGDIVGCGVDFDGNSFFFSVNGVSFGTLQLNSYVDTVGRTFYPFAEAATVTTTQSNTVTYEKILKYRPTGYLAW